MRGGSGRRHHPSDTLRSQQKLEQLKALKFEEQTDANREHASRCAETRDRIVSAMRARIASQK